MTPLNLILATLATWIVTHTVSSEIPVTSQARKPFSCQLCLSGWIVICASGLTALAAFMPGYDWDPQYLLQAGAIWAGSVFLEAAYHQLKTIII